MKCDCDDWTSQPRTLLAEKHKWVHCPWCGKVLRADETVNGNPEKLILRDDILERIDNLESALHNRKAEITWHSDVFEALERRVAEVEDGKIFKRSELITVMSKYFEAALNSRFDEFRSDIEKKVSHVEALLHTMQGQIDLHEGWMKQESK
jgi:hypothetical protein